MTLMTPGSAPVNTRSPNRPVEFGGSPPTLSVAGGGGGGGGGSFNPPNTGSGKNQTQHTTLIDPMNSLRQRLINFNVQAPQVNPGTLDFGGFSLDPGMFAGGGQFGIDEQGIGDGFNVTPQSVQRQAMAAFQSQLPKMDIAFRDASDDLAARTAAMGRTGSGLFNRDTGYISDRARAERESLLGNLAYGAATTDASNNLQAQIATGQFDQASKSRLLNARQFGSGQALQAALANAQNNLTGQQFDIGNRMDADMFNAQNTMNLGMERLGLMERQQARQDMLASQAQNDLMAQMGFLQSGYSSNPVSTMMGGAGQYGNLAGMYGDNASQIQASLAAAGQAAGQAGAGGIGDFLDYMEGFVGGAEGGGGDYIPATPYVPDLSHIEV